MGVWIDAGGQTLAHTTGTAWGTRGSQSIGKVESPAERGALRAAKAAGTRPEFLHTHPAAHGSLSKADLRWALRERFAAIHAIGTGPKGTGHTLYTLRPGPKAGPGGLWNRDTLQRHDLLARFSRIETRVNARLDRAIRRGTTTEAQAEATWAHMVWTQLAREVGPDVLRYSATPLS